MNENLLTTKLIEKSQEAFILAIEIYNKPTIKYRVEGFSFFMCNAWELLLKAVMLKNNKNIYYKDNPDRTLNLENCIKQIMTNAKDPVRLNLEQIISLRNTSTHFITEEYEQIYVPLFQSCVNNYINRLLNDCSIDITGKLNSNFITLSVKLDPIDPNIIQARYPVEIADRLMKINNNINHYIEENNNMNFAVIVRHEYCLTKKAKEATATFSVAKDGDIPVKIIKTAQDMKEKCPYNMKACIKKINGWIKRDGLNFINPSASVNEEKKHDFNKNHFGMFVDFYHIKDNPDYCYQYEAGTQVLYTYSNTALNLIYDAIKKSPESIIQSLKSELKK